MRTVLVNRRHTLKPGDVVALNNPFNGGTHLPDVTVITPVFDAGGQAIQFFLGSRGHHADIGGITPGSTPPMSRTLEEEGVVIDDLLQPLDEWENTGWYPDECLDFQDLREPFFSTPKAFSRRTFGLHGWCGVYSSVFEREESANGF